VPDRKPNRPFSEGLAAEIRELAAESDQRVQVQIATNEAVLQQEIADPAWSAEVFALIDDAVASEELAATSVQDVECRATLCRVEVVHESLEAKSAFEQQFFTAVAQVLPQAMLHTATHEDGSARTVMYLLRDSYDFPEFGISR
jgi:hypothetical protein